ncbi:MAG: hypothetical protein ACJAUG_002221 [Halioglobus sp.]|jgi:hypothetical protein
MKMFRRVTIGMVLAGVAAPSMAASSTDNDHLALCKSELKRIYGEDTRLKLKSIKKQRGGNQMRIQSVVDGLSAMSTCWIDREGGINLLDHEGVAIEVPAYDDTEKVTLNN